MSDDFLDVQLRTVPLPAGLLARLRAIGQSSDQELDCLLRDVSVPAGLVARLQNTPDDEELDERLRDVPIPVSVLVRAHNIPSSRRRSRVADLALAASLMILVSAGYLAVLAGMLVRMRGPQKDAAEWVLLDRGPLNLALSQEAAVPFTAGTEPGQSGGAATAAGDGRREFDLLPVATERRPGAAEQLLAEMGTGWDPWRNWLLRRWGVLGYVGQEPERRWELETVPPLSVRGWEAALSHALDREFLFGRNTYPPILLRIDPALATVSLPLSVRTESYELTRRLVAEHRLPEPEQVHVEDFLAAMDYRLAPVEPGRLAIRTAAGPSVFNPAAAGLLQVAVKAGGPVRRAVPASHLTVALDVSASMGWDGRLDRVRRALARLWGHLGADDRFSLVVFHDEAVLAVDQCGRDEVASVLQVVDNLHAYGNADLGAGIRAGVAAAMETEAHRPLARRLVLVTDRDLPELLVASAKNVLQEAQGHGLTFAVVDMSDTAEADTRLAQLARQVGGTLSRARSAEDLRWALLETLTGEPSAAAHETRLQVAFNPRSVAAYRVVGHAATAAAGLLPAGVECDLRQGQEASLLFEVWLRPNDENEVAVAKLRWRNPASSQPVEVPAQRISRLQFATSFEGSPLPLQAAAIAAETAEILRQGYAFEVPSETAYRYRPKPRTLHDVLAAARRANPDLAARPEFQRYVSLVEDAQRLYAARRAETAKAGVRGLIAGRWREAGE